MTIDEMLQIGVTVELGSHTFEADEIKAFAARYDPQPFHLDEEAARHNVYGRLCASGWHTTATFMRATIDRHDRTVEEVARAGGELVFGPSPGFKDLKWLCPVYVGDTITFRRVAVSHRALQSRPGWRVLSVHCEGHNQKGELVVSFDSAVLIRIRMPGDQSPS